MVNLENERVIFSGDSRVALLRLLPVVSANDHRSSFRSAPGFTVHSPSSVCLSPAVLRGSCRGQTTDEHVAANPRLAQNLTGSWQAIGGVGLGGGLEKSMLWKNEFERKTIRNESLASTTLPCHSPINEIQKSLSYNSVFYILLYSSTYIYITHRTRASMKTTIDFKIWIAKFGIFLETLYSQVHSLSTSWEFFGRKTTTMLKFHR